MGESADSDERSSLAPHEWDYLHVCLDESRLESRYHMPP